MEVFLRAAKRYLPVGSPGSLEFAYQHPLNSLRVAFDGADESGFRLALRAFQVAANEWECAPTASRGQRPVPKFSVRRKPTKRTASAADMAAGAENMSVKKLKDTYKVSVATALRRPGRGAQVPLKAETHMSCFVGGGVAVMWLCPDRPS